MLIIALLPMNAWLLIPLKCFHSETSVVSIILATRLAKHIWYLRWELCIHCSTIVETDQNQQQYIVILCSLNIYFLNRTAMTAALKSSGGINNCFSGATLLFRITKPMSGVHLLVGILDGPLHTPCLKMRHQTREVAFCRSQY